MHKPKVLVLGKLPPPYIGPAVATEILLNSTLKTKFELLHLDTNINASVGDFGKARLSKLQALRKLYKKFAELLKTEQPQVVLLPISQTTMGFAKEIPFIRIAAKYKVQVLLHLRGSNFKNWYGQSSVAVQKVVRANLKKCAGVIVLGDNLKHLFSDFFAEAQIHVVRNGNDYQFPPRKSRRLQVLYLANFLPGKGLYELLQAMKFLKQQSDLPDFDLVAHGAWDSVRYRRACENFVADNHLDFVHLKAPVSGPEKWQLLANSDIFVFCPLHPEGQPWNIVEAMAAALPVITTDRGSIQEMVTDKVNGFLLAHPDPEAIADKLQILLANPALRQAMGEASKERHGAYFSAEAMVAAMEQCLKKVLYPEIQLK